MANAQQIKPHMEVVGNDGEHVGIVDCVEGPELKLDPADSKDGLHHFIALGHVEYVDDRVHLNRTSTRAMAEWR